MKVTAKAVDGSEHEVDVDEMTWRPSVYGIVIHDGKILLSPQHGLGYDLPGGGMEMHENFEQTVIREVKEETGIDVKPISVVGCHDSLFIRSFTGSIEQKAEHSIQVYMRCEMTGGKLSTEGLDEDERDYTQLAEWIDISAIAKLPTANSVDFRKYIQKAVKEVHNGN